jgi:hypothetical protein
MTGNLISSGSDTDLRIGMVVTLALAIVVSVVMIVGHPATEARRVVALSASAPELVRPAAKLVAEHPADARVAVE